jgi:hypothetical protein
MAGDTNRKKHFLVKACYSYQPSYAIFGLNSLPSIAAFTNPEQRELLPNHHPRRREHLTHVLAHFVSSSLFSLAFIAASRSPR